MAIKTIVYTSEMGNLVTDTVKVAELLKRRHSNITKSVRNYIDKNPDQRIFYEKKYIIRGKEQPMFVMNQVGFLVVCEHIPGIKPIRDEVWSQQFGQPLHTPVERKPATPGDLFDDAPEDEKTIDDVVSIRIDKTDGKRAVNARDLHSYLQVKTKFTDWMKERISKYGFIKNEDYQIITFRDSGNGIAQTGRTEYALTIDCAKELAMVEGNERGKMARRYFIQVEKTFRAAVESGVMPGLPRNFADALRQLAAKVEENEALQGKNQELEARVKQDAPKVALANAIIVSKSTITIKQLANILYQNGVETGQIRLFERLRKEHFLCERDGMKNQPTQRALEMGLFKIEARTFQMPDGDTAEYTVTLVTPKGQEYFVNRYLYEQQNAKQE